MAGEAVHSEIGASSMHRWARCPGSVRMSRGIERVTSAYAEEGTRAHELAAHYLEKGRWPGGVVDQEMRDNVQVYIDSVLKKWNAAKQHEGSFLLVEHRFDLSKIHPGLFGTADAVVYDPSARVLYVDDLKYGKGIPVEVENNEQLLYYGLGALISTEVPCEELVLTIAQPRCAHPKGPVREWRVPVWRVVDFVADLIDAAKRTEDPLAPLKAGDHCHFCPAAGICPEIHSKALAAAKSEFRTDLSYDPKKLAATLSWLPVLESWIKSVKNFAYAEAFHGRTPPGFKLAAKRASRKWKNEDEAVQVLEDIHGLDRDEIFDRSLKSPAAVEKLLGKKAAALDELTVSISSGMVLVPEDDPRPAVKLDAKSEFSMVQENGETEESA